MPLWPSERFPARAGDEGAFRELSDPYRGELQLRCYRILGTVQDAEDLVQDTLLAAWRGLGLFEGDPRAAPGFTASTNRCLERAARQEPSPAVDGVVTLLTYDAWPTMPPQPVEYQGQAAIASFLHDRAALRGRPLRLAPARANGQPPFGCYLPDAQTRIARPYGLMVVTLQGDQISAITSFGDSSVFPNFGLPRTLRGERR